MGETEDVRVEVCAVVGCDDPVKVKSRRLCSKHYQRWQKHGDPEYVAPPKPERTCSLADCKRKHAGKGLCTVHLRRFNKHGDPLYVTPQEEYSGRTRKKTHEEAAQFMLQRDLQPLVPFTNVDTKWKCRCLRCGSEVSPSYNKVEQGGLGCWTCGRKQSGLSQRADARKAVEAMLARNFQPSVPYPGANARWPGVCLRCGQPGAPTRSQALLGGVCLFCAGHRVDSAVAIGKAMAVGWKPLDPYISAKSPWRCRCMTCGEIDTPNYDPMTRGHGCNACARRANGLANAVKLRASARERCARLADEGGFTEIEFTHRQDPRGQEISWIKFVCPNGHDGERRLSAFMQQQGCWSCASRGFNVSKRGVFYAVRSASIVKCGIANSHSAARRLDTHRRQGLTEQVGGVLFSRGIDAVTMERLWLEYRDGFLDMPYLLVSNRELRDGFREAMRRTIWVDQEVSRLLELASGFGVPVDYEALRAIPPE